AAGRQELPVGGERDRPELRPVAALLVAREGVGQPAGGNLPELRGGLPVPRGRQEQPVGGEREAAGRPPVRAERPEPPPGRDVEQVDGVGGRALTPAGVVGGGRDRHHPAVRAERRGGRAGDTYAALAVRAE